MAGIEVGKRGGIVVDDQMRTSDPDIFAVGDAVEKTDCVTGEECLVALAGPANRQGRIAADVIAGRDSRFRGTQGTAILGCLRRRGRLDRRQREDPRRRSATTTSRRSTSSRTRTPGTTRGHAARHEGRLPQVRRTSPRRAGAWARRSGGRQADRRPRRWPSSWAATDLRPGGVRALLRARVRRRQVAPQLRRHGRRQRPARRHAHRPLGRRRTAASSSTCATPRSSPSSNCRGWSTSRWTSSADAWTSCPATVEILVICRSGQRAYYATRILVQNGFTARNVAGGMLSHEIFATV